MERRQAERARVVGTAIVLTRDRYVGTFLLENVSADGALLAGDSELSVGEQVRAMLQVHGSPRIGVRGKIARHAERDGQHLFALSFKATPAIQDLLQRAALRLLEVPSPITLVVEEGHESCKSLTSDLKLMGHTTVGVRTALDAIGWLHAPGVHVETIAVGSKIADMDGMDLLEFVAVDYPQIRRVLVCKSCESLEGVSGLPHAVLTNPWRREALAEAFQRSEP